MNGDVLMYVNLNVCILPFRYFSPFQDGVRYSDVTTRFVERMNLAYKNISKAVQMIAYCRKLDF